MDRIQELLEQLRNPGEDGVPDSIYDDIAGAYNEALEIRDAKINELSSAAQEHEAQISALKSANYDLLMASGAPSDDEGDDGGDDDGDEPSGVDSLFDNEEN